MPSTSCRHRFPLGRLRLRKFTFVNSLLKEVNGPGLIKFAVLRRNKLPRACPARSRQSTTAGMRGNCDAGISAGPSAEAVQRFRSLGGGIHLNFRTDTRPMALRRRRRRHRSDGPVKSLFHCSMGRTRIDRVKMRLQIAVGARDVSDSDRGKRMWRLSLPSAAFLILRDPVRFLRAG